MALDAKVIGKTLERKDARISRQAAVIKRLARLLDASEEMLTKHGHADEWLSERQRIITEIVAERQRQQSS